MKSAVSAPSFKEGLRSKVFMIYNLITGLILSTGHKGDSAGLVGLWICGLRKNVYFAAEFPASRTYILTEIFRLHCKWLGKKRKKKKKYS